MNHKQNQTTTQPQGTEIPKSSQEKNLHERSSGRERDLDYENFPEPVSFENEGNKDLAREEDLDRVEQDNPKADDADDIKDSR